MHSLFLQRRQMQQHGFTFTLHQPSPTPASVTRGAQDRNVRTCVLSRPGSRCIFYRDISHLEVSGFFFLHKSNSATSSFGAAPHAASQANSEVLFCSCKAPAENNTEVLQTETESCSERIKTVVFRTQEEMLYR